jgi:hypothetical protein
MQLNADKKFFANAKIMFIIELIIRTFAMAIIIEITLRVLFIRFIFDLINFFYR